MIKLQLNTMTAVSCGIREGDFIADFFNENGDEVQVRLSGETTQELQKAIERYYEEMSHWHADVPGLK